MAVSKFQKRHYDAIADLFHKERESMRIVDVPTSDEVAYWSELHTIENRFVELFEQDNENFDKHRFLEAVENGV